MIYVITCNGTVIGTARSLDIAKACVSITWDERYIKDYLDNRSFTLVTIERRDRTGKQLQVIIAPHELAEVPTHL